MIALLLLWLIAVVAIPAVALLLFLAKRKGKLRQFAIESVLFIAAMICLGFLGERPAYHSGRDTIHAFGNGRFQIFADSDAAYVFIDEAADSLTNKAIMGVLKWAEAKDGYCLITSEGHFHFVDSKTGKRTTYSKFNDIPSPQRETFRRMRYWGPYGQLWEDASHVHWKWFALVGLLFVWGIRIVMLIVTSKRKDRCNEN